MELKSPMSPFENDFKNYFNTENEDEDYDFEEVVTDNYDDEIECWPGLIDNVPDEFYNFVNNFYDIAEEKVKFTFCIWRKYSDPAWQIGKIDFSLLPSRYRDPDGTEHLLYFLVTVRTLYATL
jgi:hypothetical protein